MELRKIIENYSPFDYQEQIDKLEILNYMDIYEDLFLRANEEAHFTSSAFIVNKERTKVLVVYHKIYDSYAWPGGHADGDKNLLEVAKREVKEETGLNNFSLVMENIFLLDISITSKHIKNGLEVPTHKHLSIAYLFEADENETLHNQPEENTEAVWIDVNEIVDKMSEFYMKRIFSKAIKRIKEENI